MIFCHDKYRLSSYGAKTNCFLQCGICVVYLMDSGDGIRYLNSSQVQKFNTPRFGDRINHLLQSCFFQYKCHYTIIICTVIKQGLE